MGDTIEFQSRVGADGILDLRIPLDDMGAGAEVLVTIRRVRAPSVPPIDPAERRRILDESYGSCANSGLERRPEGEYEMREAPE